MLRKEKDGIVWLEFELLQPFPHIRHAVFLRHGGVSAPPFHTLNIGFQVGDPDENVKENRQRMLSALELNNVPRLATGSQVHGNRCVCITQAEDINVESCDALLTDVADVALLIKHADCQAALFFDPVHNVIANAHAGWRGSVQNIYKTVVEQLMRTYKSRPEDLIVCISPSLGPEQAEFIHYKEELPESFWSFQTKPNYFDFWKISTMQLLACGIQNEHIEIASLCTYSNPHDFFSYRRDKITGRHGTMIQMV
jgi:YfiH family protein